MSVRYITVALGSETVRRSPRSLQLGWLPTLELADGLEVVALEDLAATVWGRLEWPVFELPDGRLAVLVDDLVAGGVVA